MAFRYEVFSDDSWAERAAAWIAGALPANGSLVVTGGHSARRLYPALAKCGRDLNDFSLWFSDERCVPPDDENSNFRLVRETLVEPLGLSRIARMRGEDPPEVGARRYEVDMTPVAARGIDVAVLGLGENTHICGLFPKAPSLLEEARFVLAVSRPDGMNGITLSPRALRGVKRAILLAQGARHAEAVARVLESHEPVETCPARLLARNPDVTLLLDESAASRLRGRRSQAA